MVFKVPEKARVKHGFMGSTHKDGNNGMFAFADGLVVIALDRDWETRHPR